MDFINIGRVTPKIVLKQRLKAATFGGEPDAGFERDFASLAFSYIKDKAPMLVDNMVGFQLLERSPDTKKAVGIFGCRVGKQWFYLPSIFANGEIKGHEVCYLKNQDVMIPLKENWINYIISQKSSILGEGRSNAFDAGILRPDYTTVLTPPYGKTAGLRAPRPQRWAAECGAIQDVVRLVSNPQSLGRVVNSLSKQAAYAVQPWHSMTLDQVASESTYACQQLRKMANKYPLIRSGLDRWYGKDFLDRMDKAAASHEQRLSSQRFNREVPRSLVGAVKQASSPSDELRIYLSGQSLLQPPDEVKTKLARDGYAIVDRRPDEKVAAEIAVESHATELASPTETGMYEVLMEDGSLERCHVFVGPRGRDKDGKCSVVRRTSDGAWCFVNSSDVLAQSPAEGDDIPATESPMKWYQNLPGADGMTTDTWYVYVMENGESSLPFIRWGDVACSPSSGEVVDKEEVYFDHPCDKSLLGRDLATWSKGLSHSCCESNTSYINRLKRDTDGDRITSVRDTVYVPKGAKLVKLTKSKLALGDLKSAMDLLLKKTAQLKLLEDGNEILVNGRRMGKVACLLHLVKDHGFREDAAKSLLKSAAKSGKIGNGYVTRVKYAAGQQTPMLASDFLPTTMPFPDMDSQNISAFTPGQGRSRTYNPTPSTYGMQFDREQFVPSSSGERYQVIDDMPDGQLMQAAQRAAQKGDKELFDAAGIGSIFRGTPRKDMLHQYLPKWTAALDALCRGYLSFLWFGSALAEQYGDADMPEIEDSFTRSIDVFGDLILEIKDKTIEPYSGTDSGPDLAPQE